MKIRVMSDLHLEFSDFIPEKIEGTDAVILAGDIGSGLNGIAWASKHFGDVPIIYVPGNHEYYGWDMTVWQTEAYKTARAKGIVLGNCSSTLIGNVRIFAAPLWTDFALYGEDRIESCGKEVARCLYDYSAIKLDGKTLTWQDTRAICLRTQAWLRAEAAKARQNGEKVVIATHHAPSLQSALPKYKNDPVTAGFASALDDLAADYADYWIHGHMHNNAWYKIGNCTVVANPRGYRPPHENPRFDKGLFIEV
jgi:predicted phosphodiesterase